MHQASDLERLTFLRFGLAQSLLDSLALGRVEPVLVYPLRLVHSSPQSLALAIALG
jgi:hypothetical protein